VSIAVTGVARGRVQAARAALDRPLATYYLLLGSAGMLLGLGLIMVLSASSVYSFTQYHNSYYIFLKQLIWVIVALPVAWVATRLSPRLLMFLAWPGVVISTILIGLTQSGLGRAVNGNRNWLAFGPFTMQPSEIAKLSVILLAAGVYARKEKLLKDWRHIIIPVAPVIGAVTLLVVAEHDLGTALVLFAILVGMLWIAGLPGRMFAIAFGVVAVVAFYLAATSSNRLTRLQTFTDPFAHFHGAGWQAAHGLIGMASGGILGKGLGASQQKWGNLPEAHTDFIFAVIGEELGLVGTLLVLALFAVFAWSAIRLATQTSDAFVRYTCFGVVLWLMVQMMINVGMVLALLPVIGIPLPLVSYGGSALLPSLIAVGLLVGFARREPEAAAALRDRRRARRQARPADGRAGSGINSAIRRRVERQ
jgi:cell division protein FtsW